MSRRMMNDTRTQAAPVGRMMPTRDRCLDLGDGAQRGTSGSAFAGDLSRAGGGGLFAWLHEPVGHSLSNVGLVICKPFGYESVCAFRSIRLIAQEAASVGI